MPAPILFGSQSNVHASGADQQDQNDVVALADGRYLVAWQDSRGTGAEGDIQLYGRYFNADGSPVGSDFVINTAATNFQEHVRLAALDGGGFVATWTAAESNGGTGDDGGQSVRARIFDGAGNGGTEFLVNVTTVNSQVRPDIAVLDDGRFVITWVDTNNTDVTSVRSRMFNADGSPATGELMANDTNLTFPAPLPTVAALTGGGFVVAWRNTVNAENTIRATIYTDAGTPINASFLVSQNGSDSRAPSVTELTNGNFVVAWGDQFRIFNSAGSAVTNEIALATNSDLDIIALRDGRFAVVRQSPAVSGDDIFINVFSAAGVADGDPLNVNGASSGTQSVPSITELADGRLVVTWDENFSSGNVTQQIVDPRETAVTLAGTSLGEQFIGTAFNDTLDGGAGDDTLRGVAGNDTYVIDSAGDVADESFTGSGGTDTVQSASFVNLGNTTQFLGLIENLTLTGTGDVDGTGNGLNNVITGTIGINTLNGAGGNDTLRGGDGNDTLNGDQGSDQLVGGLNADVHNGGDGFDYVRYDDANYGNLRISLIASGTNTGAAAVGDTYIDIEGAVAGSGNDVVYGNNLDNILIGNNGNDTLFGGLGADSLRGGDGVDYARYDDAVYGNLVLSLANAAQNSGTGAAGDLYNSIEGFIAGTGNDRIGGNGFINYLYGAGGDDIIAGNDGNDTLSGGAGLDTFRFNTPLNAATNRDTILDFVAADDTIELDRSFFSNTLPLGVLSADRFNTGAAASDASDRIIYNQATGALFFDADGSGSTFAQVQFATLSTKPTITNADFVILA